MFIIGDKVRYIGTKYPGAVGTVLGCSAYRGSSCRWYNVKFGRRVSAELPGLDIRRATLTEAWMRSNLELHDRIVGFFRSPPLNSDYYRPVPMINIKNKNATL